MLVAHSTTHDSTKIVLFDLNCCRNVNINSTRIFENFVVKNCEICGGGGGVSANNIALLRFTNSTFVK